MRHLLLHKHRFMPDSAQQWIIKKVITGHLLKSNRKVIEIWYVQKPIQLLDLTVSCLRGTHNWSRDEIVDKEWVIQ